MIKKLAILAVVLLTVTIAQGKWLWPVRGPITQGYGSANHGIDIAVPEGTPVLASQKGTVEKISQSDIYGLLVMVKHSGGYETLYAHNSKVLVQEGATVIAGTKIALSGSTGKSTGPHVHFEIRQSGAPVDPMNYLAK